MNQSCAIILAAGDGKRMKSRRPKALCQVLFKPMIQWVTDWCRKAQIEDLCVVLGEGGEQILPVLPEGTVTVKQEQRLGTAHAVRQAEDFLRQHPHSPVAVLCADAPFVTDQVLRDSLTLHLQSGAQVTVITASVEDPTGYGRILRDPQDPSRVLGIVEQKDADCQQAQIREVNSGAYWFEAGFLLEALDEIGCNNSQGEYYLTDAVQVAVKKGKKAAAFRAQDPKLVLGANDRAGLLRLNEIANKIVIDRLLQDGVNFYCTDGVVISPDAVIGADTTIAPGTQIKGRVRIGEGCQIGPNTEIRDSVIGDDCVIHSSYIEESTMGNGVRIGPNSHLRPGCVLADKVKIGNFVELKNSTLGEKSSVAHLTYIGDTDIGARVNMGGGCITVNYDGFRKFRTTIGDDAFIGCNTNLIAPVTVHDRAFVAAGSTIYEEVSEDALAIARARQVEKEGWAVRYREKNAPYAKKK